MSWVIAKPGENIDSLIKRFKKAVDKSGLLADLKKHEFYEKPSVKRKRKQAASRKRVAKELKKLGRQEMKVSNQNFKWNRDHTKKIPTPPPRPNAPRPNYRGQQTQSRPYTNSNSGYTNRPTQSRRK